MPAPSGAVTPSWKLLLTLGAAGAASGLAIVLVYTATLPRVEAYEAGITREAIGEVLHAPARSDTLWLSGGALTATRPVTEAGTVVERVYRGYDASGAATGYAIEAVGPGFSENIRLMVGYDPAKGALLGMKVLESKETPGIADSVVGPAFTRQFTGAAVPVVGARPTPKGPEPGQVVMITGATISSRAVIKAVNRTLERWEPLLARYESGLRRTAAAGDAAPRVAATATLPPARKN
jgi:electron transport complex protein RnfG